jgi:hypothetical protein
MWQKRKKERKKEREGLAGLLVFSFGEIVGGEEGIFSLLTPLSLRLQCGADNSAGKRKKEKGPLLYTC